MATLGQVHATMQALVSGAVSTVLTGGGATAVIGGTVTAGDICSIIFTATKLPMSPVTISYTVQIGDTLSAIALALALKINGSSVLGGQGVGATVSGASITVSAPTQLAITYTEAVTGPSPTETISITEGLLPVVAVGWPAVNTLQASVAQNGQCVANVYDRKLVRNTTRWMPFSYGDTVMPATLTTVISNSYIGAGASRTITLGGTVTAGDAVSCVIVNSGVVPPQSWAEVVIGVAGDTATTMAAKLAAAIIADTNLNPWLIASSAGAVVTLTSRLVAGDLILSSYTGNGGTRTMEIGRRQRELQIVIWAQTEEDRQSVGDPIEELLVSLNSQFGVTFSDGTVGRLVMGADYYCEDDTLQDVYRRDFLFSLDYPITATDALYSVLAPVQQYQTQ